jgi:STAS-like domain of unknown function (DUF4325)
VSTTTISIAKDFSPVPAGRHLTDGPFPGSKFRDAVLVPALEAFDQVTIDLDGTEGYGSSFLEESFGGLIRKGYSEEQLRHKLRFRTSRLSYETRIWNYVRNAAHGGR